MVIEHAHIEHGAGKRWNGQRYDCSSCRREPRLFRMRGTLHDTKLDVLYPLADALLLLRDGEEVCLLTEDGYALPLWTVNASDPERVSRETHWLAE